MNESRTVQRQLTQLAIALATGALVICATLVFTSYRERASRQLLYDYHLVSETSARALYAADARIHRPLRLLEFSATEITDVQSYASHVLLEYGIMLKHADRILALDRRFANPNTARIIARLQLARDQLDQRVAGMSPQRLATAVLNADNGLDIGLLAEQLFRIHRSAFVKKHADYDAQRRLQSVGLLLMLIFVCGLGAIYWVKTRKAIGDSLVREREAVRISILAEESSVAKTGFLSRMSHELRTPLNAILGFGQLLNKDPQHVLSSRQSNQVDEIVSAGEHLLELVNEVLDLNLIEQGKLKLDLQAVTVAPELEACMEQLQPALRQQNLSVTLDVPISHQVQADRLRLRQVLLNLLSNAIKYNHKGGEIRIWSRLSSSRLRINVQDTGPGIELAAQERLFNAFERIEPQSNASEGAGIGLALSKQLVDIMLGDIGLESQPGHGSTFWFELPLPLEQGDIARQKV